ncbi:hypothetical protein IEU95_11390 [Hoyosella rhizosphaerae]|uniref:Uncharacterized protein n=1 Tax=Hoyosella rhizosphaerae TaxID=1755582 RepID=A0A916U9S6_9ACTN|nr:DUF6474 family protein [Hoyosella rhizosphaerae]MBN4927438.1 hypothetical protein [Hoyosella rhizosphaerae]GGC64374.1 hypothetical protein GCM10011410_16160 [Hoyosella rhizosphaerae]
MGLFSKKPSRATRKAEAKALKVKAKTEAKLAAKQNSKNANKALKFEQKLAKQADKARSRAEKAQMKISENEVKIAQQQAQAAAEGKMTVTRARRIVGVTRILAPVLVPVLYRSVTAVRGYLDSKRAQSFGIPLEELGKFTGYGAKLSARIAGAEASTREVYDRDPKNAEVKQFTEAINKRLEELNMAVRAAERMAPARRRAAHQAIGTELDGIEADLLARLGVR